MDDYRETLKIKDTAARIALAEFCTAARAEIDEYHELDATDYLMGMIDPLLMKVDEFTNLFADAMVYRSAARMAQATGGPEALARLATNRARNCEAETPARARDRPPLAAAIVRAHLHRNAVAWTDVARICRAATTPTTAPPSGG
jgi:hypothetical protein